MSEDPPAPAPAPDERKDEEAEGPMRFCGVESDEEEGTEVYDMGDMGREVVGEDERESKGSC